VNWSTLTSNRYNWNSAIVTFALGNSGLTVYSLWFDKTDRWPNVEPVQCLHQRLQGTGGYSSVQGHGQVGGFLQAVRSS